MPLPEVALQAEAQLQDGVVFRAAYFRHRAVRRKRVVRFVPLCSPTLSDLMTREVIVSMLMLSLDSGAE
eukprot:12457299-Alexandrium_andersonii.AAC.1